MINRFILTVIILLQSFTINAATYYVSPTGNDSNNGTSVSTPWQTITKVNQANLQSGDKVLFQRGGTFRGKITAYANGVTYDAYGGGNNPIIAASRIATNWVQHSGNIWKTTITAPVTNLFCNNVLMTLARYPNTGWLRNNNGSNTHLSSTQLTQPSGYWTGTQAVIRSTTWSYNVPIINSYTVGTLNFNSLANGDASYNLQNYTWGFFMQNKLSELDVAGEWFYDTQTSQLYFWSPNNANPNTLTIEVMGANASGQSGILIGWLKTGIRIKNLDIRYGSYAGIENSGGYDLVIDSCKITNNYIGIKSYTNLTSGLNNIVVKHTIINNNFESGVNSVGVGHTFEDNMLLYNAVYPGLGNSSWGYITMDTYSDNTIIRRNRVIGSGYIGVAVRGNSLVERNFIDSSCTILNDGCGMGPDQSDGAIFRENIILNTIGNTESCASNWSGCDPKGKGIYFGNLAVKNTIIENNTVAYCNGAGMWVDHTMASTGNTIQGNTFFDNDLYQIGFSDFSNYSGPAAVPPYAVASYNQTITNNIFYCKNASQRTMYHINRWYSGIDFGTFTNNKHHNPWNQAIIQRLNFINGTDLSYTLAQWQSLVNDEVGSTVSQFNLTGNNGVNDHILIYNDQLTSQNVSIPSGTWKDLDGNTYVGSIPLGAFRSKVLYKDNTVTTVSLNCKIQLQGPYRNGLMIDSLRTKNLIPLSDPYTSLGYVHTLGGGETINASILSISGNSAIVDWVIVELRNPTTPSNIVYSRSGLIQRDGDIVNIDGVSPLTFNVPIGQYYIVIKHRNHLGVMTAVPYNLTTTPTIINFNTISTFGINAMVTIGGVKMMWAGDVNFDGIIKYSGTANDRDPILFNIGGTVPTNVNTGYNSEDINLDGKIKYTGQNNDRDLILFNIGGNIPTNTKSAQLP